MIRSGVLKIRLAIVVLTLAGCGSNSPFALPDVNLGSLNPFGDSTAAFEPDEEPEGPYLRLAQGRRESDARLISQQGERRMWRTRGGVVVATDGVRVVATSGLPVMVAATRFDGPDPVADPQSLATRGADARRVVDVMTASREPEAMRFGITLDCRLSSAPGTDSETIIITETCRATGLGLIRNRFWMDRETSSIHTSEQWVGPRAAPLRISHNLEAVPEAQRAPEPTPDGSLPAVVEPVAEETLPPVSATVRTGSARGAHQVRR